MQDILEYYDRITDAYNAGEVIDYDELREVLLNADKLYQNGQDTGLADDQYDRLVQMYMEATDEQIRGDMNAKKKVEHDYPTLKGTLKKVHYITKKEKDNDPAAIEGHKILYDWYENTYKQLDPTKKHFLGFWPKYDGCSMILTISSEEDGRHILKAITRGDEEIGLDKTHLFDRMQVKGVIPDAFEGKIGLKTEFIMPKSLFPEFNKKFGDPAKPFVNARTAMTSLLNSNSFTELHRKYMRLKPLLMWYNDEFKSYTMEDEDNGPIMTVPYSAKLNESELESIISRVKEEIDKLDYDCDGIVVRWYDEDAMKELGRDEANYVNKFEIAYKFPKANNYVKLLDIRQDIGIGGNLSLTAVVEPFVCNNKKIEHASLGSYERAKSLGLAVGDIVNIKYEIVPYLFIDEYCKANKSGNPPIELYDHCPYCNEPLVAEPVMCCNNPDCPSRIQGKINIFCERMGIVGVGPGIIETMFSTGLVNCLADLFTIQDKYDDFCAVDGLGELTWKNIVKQLSKLKVYEYQILASVGIKGLGVKNSKKISAIYYITELLGMLDDIDAGIEDMKRKGITEHMATITLKGVKENVNTIEAIMRNVKVESYSGKPGEISSENHYAMTGFRNAKFEKFMAKLGWECGSVTKKTKLVIAENPDGKSSKLEKARELNIPIISVPEAYQMFDFKI